MTNMDDLKAYCADGATVEPIKCSVDHDVILQAYRFEPPQPSNMTVYFVPGWISRMAGWKTVLREMTKRWSVFYLETREKNSAEIDDSASFGADALAQDLIQISEQMKLDPEKTLWFGSSLGATAILEVMHHLKKPPFALGLVGPNAEFRIPLWGKALIACFPTGLYAGFKPFVKWYLRTFRLDVEHDRAQYEKYSVALDEANPTRLKRGARELGRYTVWDRLPDISIPVLIFGGANDVMHEPGNLKIMESMLPNARYIDMGTNSDTHSEAMVQKLEQFVTEIRSTNGVPRENPVVPNKLSR